MARIASRIRIARPPDAVFDALIDPTRFTAWKDGLIAVTDSDADLDRVGAGYTANLRMLGRDTIGRYEITVCDRPHRLVQVGASAGSTTISTNRLTPAAEGGTDLDFDLEYTLPWGILGGLLDRLVLRRRLTRTLDHSHERLRDLLEASPQGLTDEPVAALATRAGVDRSVVEDLLAFGVLRPPADGLFTDGDVRRVHLVQDLARGGIPMALIGEGVRRGALNVDFVDQPGYDRFSAYESETFDDVSHRTSVPIRLLLVIREATGSPAPAPTDHIRTTELAVVPYIEGALRHGVRPEALEQTLRVAGDGARRLAETEADWWRSDILAPLLRQGVPVEEIGQRTAPFAAEIGPLTDAALVALYHGHQAHAWMRNIFDGFESALAGAGLYERIERPPAISFIDVTGYSRLTEEHGDVSATDLAVKVARLVQRVAAGHGGRTVKWLGDGLMVYHPDPGGAVAAALDLRDAIVRQGLPSTHIGIHAGPVMFQEADYFGRTVNAAARIASHATSGQILVSDAVVKAVAPEAGVTFEPVGPVELKGLLEPMTLFEAHAGGQ